MQVASTPGNSRPSDPIKPETAEEYGSPDGAPATDQTLRVTTFSRRPDSTHPFFWMALMSRNRDVTPCS